MIKSLRPVVGLRIHIGKPFESHDGIILNNRFMCIFSIENDNLMLIPMSTFHSKKERVKKLKILANFEYSKKHGNNRDGYFKCDQIYVLKMEEFNVFNEIEISQRINTEHFIKLTKYIDTLKQENKIKILKKQMIWKESEEVLKKAISFEDSFALQQEDKASESVFTDDELVRMRKIEQKNLKKIRKYEKDLKKSQQVAQAADETDNQFDDYER